jgi:hypothetical protein
LDEFFPSALVSDGMTFVEWLVVSWQQSAVSVQRPSFCIQYSAFILFSYLSSPLIFLILGPANRPEGDDFLVIIFHNLHFFGAANYARVREWLIYID